MRGNRRSSAPSSRCVRRSPPSARISSRCWGSRLATAARCHRRNAAPGAVVSHRFWVNSLGGSTERLLSIDGYDIQVVGVLPPGMEYPIGTDVWYPLELIEQYESRTAHNYIVIGRLRGGVPAAPAHSE